MAEELSGSTLRVWLLEQSAWGLLSLQQVQAASERALQDARNEHVLDLDPPPGWAAMVSSNNVNLDLMRMVRNESKMIQPSRLTLRTNLADVAVPIPGVPTDEHCCTISLPRE